MKKSIIGVLSSVIAILVGLLLVGIRWGVLGVCWAKVVGNVVEAGVNALFAAKMFRDASRGGPS